MREWGNKPQSKLSVLKNKGMYLSNSFKTEMSEWGLQKHEIAEHVVSVLAYITSACLVTQGSLSSNILYF